MELYGTLRLGEKFRNFMELFNVSYGTEQLHVCYTPYRFQSTNEVTINDEIKRRKLAYYVGYLDTPAE